MSRYIQATRPSNFVVNELNASRTVSRMIGAPNRLQTGITISSLRGGRARTRGPPAEAGVDPVVRIVGVWGTGRVTKELRQPEALVLPTDASKLATRGHPGQNPNSHFLEPDITVQFGRSAATEEAQHRADGR
jgi:hypothetical protein